MKKTLFTLTALTCALLTTESLAERILVDFGMANETTLSPDGYGHYWNNIAGPDAQLLEAVTYADGSAASGVTISMTDSYASSNSLGGETIYVPTATGDFLYVQKTGSIRPRGQSIFSH